ncbi:MAG: glucosamine-6-phosphate deaminase [Alphaproteobacteria bacterium]
MRVRRDFGNENDMAMAAAEAVAADLRAILATKPRATVMFATGTSQLKLLAQLIKQPAIDWGRVRMCHLDEYIGIEPSHRASFVHYLQNKLLAHLPFAQTVLIDGMARDADKECARLGQLLPQGSVDLGLVGIGENCHIAFNDPPADFETRASFIVVDLDEACRRQQVNEGWFASIAEVPKQAISASVNFILSADRIHCVVPGARKAQAVCDCLEGEISPQLPASVLRRHNAATLYLDAGSASLLNQGQPAKC